MKKVLTKKISYLTSILVLTMVFFGFPFNLLQTVPEVKAAGFLIQVGMYVGDGTDNRQITGIGFQPEMVMVKEDNTSGTKGIVLKTSNMPGETTIALAESDAVSTSNIIQSLDSDGFTIGSDADINTANDRYHWVAFAGSDCTSGGDFCIGSYTGNGTSQNITSVGFQPNFVAVKRSGASTGVFRTSSMTGTESAYFETFTNLASGGVESLISNGFSVGSNAVANTSGQTYYYFAFKNSSYFDEGTYTGNAVDDRVIDSTHDAGLTFEPNLVIAKGNIAQTAIMNTTESSGDRSMSLIDTSGLANGIQKLNTGGGFEIGTNASINTNTTTYYYLVFGGASPMASATGTFSYAQGSYVGTGSPFSVTGLSFSPDLIIIKNEDQATDQYAVFRTSLNPSADTTSGFVVIANFTGGITSITSNGFTLGTSATVNTSGDTYYWVAFGGANKPGIANVSKDFMIGRYVGDSKDNRPIRRLSFANNVLAIKSQGGVSAYWRTSHMAGDASVPFTNIGVSGNVIQSITSNSFVIGSSSAVNNGSVLFDFFGFGDSNCSEAGKLCVNSYTGNGSSQNITSVGFQPDLVWIKKRTGGTPRHGIFKTSAQNANAVSYFSNFANVTTNLTNLIKNGFSLTTGVEANESGFTYDYVAWDGKEYTQSTYRFFENADSTDVGAVLGAQNTPVTLSAAGEPFRMRMNIRSDHGSLFPSGKDFKLQYVDKGSGTCASPTGGTPASYTDVTSGTLIAFNNNATPSNGAALTSNANDPTDSGRTIVNQTYVEANNFTNSQGTITQALQTGKWDFSLIDNGAPEGTTYCFRVVGATSATPIHTYSAYPEITTASNATQEISMTISDNSIGFGTLSSSAAKFATGDTLGSSSDSSDAHTISASTNADGGYVISLNGTTLQCVSCGNGADINPIGSSATSSSVGTEQFGLRGIVNSGTGTVSSPYNQSSQFAFDSTAFPDVFATGAGDNTTTTYGLRYLGNISSVTDAGAYAGVLTYTITASF